MQLRKCVNHPYLFHGAEPEPFAEGDHIFENAGKFALLDRLLPYLKQRGHRVLLFSTSVQSLDICQDYLGAVPNKSKQRRSATHFQLPFKNKAWIET